MKTKRDFFKMLRDELLLFETFIEKRKKEISIAKVQAHSDWEINQFEKDSCLEELEMLSRLEKFHDNLKKIIHSTRLAIEKNDALHALSCISEIISSFEKLNVKPSPLYRDLRIAETIIFQKYKNRIPSA